MNSQGGEMPLTIGRNKKSNKLMAKGSATKNRAKGKSKSFHDALMASAMKGTSEKKGGTKMYMG